MGCIEGSKARPLCRGQGKLDPTLLGHRPAPCGSRKAQEVGLQAYHSVVSKCYVD